MPTGEVYRRSKLHTSTFYSYKLRLIKMLHSVFIGEANSAALSYLTNKPCKAYNFTKRNNITVPRFNSYILKNSGRDPFSQNSDRSDREKRTTSKGGPVFSKLFPLDRTDPLSFGPKFPEILVEWIAPSISYKDVILWNAFSTHFQGQFTDFYRKVKKDFYLRNFSFNTWLTTIIKTR